MTIAQHDIIQARAASTASGSAAHDDDRGAQTDAAILRLAVAGYQGRYKGQTWVHIASDLRVVLTWCDDHDLDPLDVTDVGRAQVEEFVRWMQVSRRVSVLAGFYRTAVIDGLVARSPVEHVRRPRVPAESPTLGLSHLQFEATLIAARQSTHAGDFALV